MRNGFFGETLHVEYGKSEHHQGILHIGIRISLGTKFQFKLAILIPWTKFSQKWYFRMETMKLKYNIEFCRFELV